MRPIYNTKTFADMFPEYDSFLSDYHTVGIEATIKGGTLKNLYYLLYARYGNSPMANRDENQFKYKLFSVVFQYGPTWEKKLEIQKTVRELDEEELRLGSKMISNHAYNPSTEPSTASLEELNQINEQSANIQKRSKLEAYARLWDMLATDVTSEFINRFSVCFKQFVLNENPLLYATPEDEGE